MFFFWVEGARNLDPLGMELYQLDEVRARKGGLEGRFSSPDVNKIAMVWTSSPPPSKKKGGSSIRD